ncbi:hypothetical protein Tsubulata_038870, partial [Turnera subulata]
VIFGIEWKETHTLIHKQALRSYTYYNVASQFTIILIPLDLHSPLSLLCPSRPPISFINLYSFFRSISTHPRPYPTAMEKEMPVAVDDRRVNSGSSGGEMEDEREAGEVKKQAGQAQELPEEVEVEPVEMMSKAIDTKLEEGDNSGNSDDVEPESESELERKRINNRNDDDLGGKREEEVTVLESHSGREEVIINSSTGGGGSKEDIVVEYAGKERDLLGSHSHQEEESTERAPQMLFKEGDETVTDGAQVPEMEAADRSLSSSSGEAEGSSAWPEKSTATFKNFVRGVMAATSFLRALTGKGHEEDDVGPILFNNEEEEYPSSAEDSQNIQPERSSSWNPLNFLMLTHDDPDKPQEGEVSQPMKGRVMVYTRLGCQSCKEVRLFLHMKRLAYVEVNIDLYPGRRLELEKFTGSPAVPKVFFNEVVIGGLDELKHLDESGKLEEKLDFLITEAPASEAPLPPLSGEDDTSSCASIDELALIARKMKEFVVIKDRFYKMRWFTSCFLGVDAVNFLSADQYLEREEVMGVTGTYFIVKSLSLMFMYSLRPQAVEFGRKMASNLFYRHILDENLFEDGNHLYRFLDDDPLVSSQCHNIPLGISVAKPKPITDIASRLRFLSYAIFEAYTSEDGKHVDYRTIHGSEEFARYLRIIQELQRVELEVMPREEKLAFFINLYNMMAIHGILVMGYPLGALERRRLFGDFKYVIGGWTYSLSAIYNGILRGNQRPPYTLMKPFGIKDKRFKVALAYPEPLIHFALVFGTRSCPALRCYSPLNIDKELTEAAHKFLRDGGLIVDPNTQTAYTTKILKWFSVDFGKNEQEVLRHAANYLEPAAAEALLELLAASQLKVIYQPYDWGLNY